MCFVLRSFGIDVGHFQESCIGLKFKDVSQGPVRLSSNGIIQESESSPVVAAYENRALIVQGAHDNRLLDRYYGQSLLVAHASSVVTNMWQMRQLW